MTTFLLATLFTTLLSVTDPPNDAVGNGSLRPPTALVYRTPGAFDLLEVNVPNTSTFGFSLTLAQLGNPWELPNGFSLPIIEIYLSGGDAGREALLPGSGMTLPEGATWDYAFRLTGDAFTVFAANPEGDAPLDITERVGAQLDLEGSTLTVTTRLPRPRGYSLYSQVGAYDPFSDTGWRPVERTPSPWAFSSRTQRVRAIDVVAEGFEQQKRAIDSGVLPRVQASVGGDGWLLLATLGLCISLVGVVGRFWLPPRSPESRRAPSVGAAPRTERRYVPLSPIPSSPVASPPVSTPLLSAPNLESGAVPDVAEVDEPGHEPLHPTREFQEGTGEMTAERFSNEEPSSKGRLEGAEGEAMTAEEPLDEEPLEELERAERRDAVGGATPLTFPDDLGEDERKRGKPPWVWSVDTVPAGDAEHPGDHAAEVGAHADEG